MLQAIVLGVHRPQKSKISPLMTTGNYPNNNDSANNIGKKTV